MKRLAVLLCLLFTLSGCSAGGKQMDRALALRSKLLSGSVRFDAKITADYGMELYSFSLECRADGSGDVSFTVSAPSSIAGIAGTVDSVGGKLTFDSTALAFGLLADGYLSPIAAPWTMLRALRSGYISACCVEAGALRITVSDSYGDNALLLDVWLNDQDLPKRADILWKGKRILSMELANFQIL